ncbi:helix-turn-helix domain-containing protein [Butyrivibrio sp. MC2013]|uniref:helix-turn-helix domain-containing protein n=1 Tax=Butyrivibrio sp. MC2013 TaxID=1280686 RepID=UPI00042371CB|nr:helix-turn-helix transcriptional regulator [Butyrivibrio sp. MC2013]
MSFGENVRRARKRIGLSQTELADQLGIAQRTISSYETDISIPRTTKLLRELAQVLEVDPTELASGDDRFLMEAQEEFGRGGRREAEELVSELAGLFAGGEMEEEDMDTLMLAVQEAYIDAKRASRKKGIVSGKKRKN